MTEKPTQDITQKGLTASQLDVAEYAVTGLSIVINQAGEESPTAALAKTIRDDFRGVRENGKPNADLSEQGWEKLQKLSAHISTGQDVPPEQASNLLVVMAGVASAVSTAGLVKAAEREVQHESPRENVTKPSVGRWTRNAQERASQPASSRQL